MSLIKFNRNRFPWNNMGWLNTDDFFSDDFFIGESNLPAMNVKEHDGDFEIELAVPGFDKKDIEVSVKDNILEVCAEKKIEKEEKKEEYTRREFSYDSFRRSMQLPSSIDDSKDVKATYKSGILTLGLQKKGEAKEKPKKVIEVN